MITKAIEKELPAQVNWSLLNKYGFKCGVRFIKYCTVASASRPMTAMMPSQLAIAKGKPKNLLWDKDGIIAESPRFGYKEATSAKHKASSSIIKPLTTQVISALGPAIAAVLNGENSQPLPITQEMPKKVAEISP